MAKREVQEEEFDRTIVQYYEERSENQGVPSQGVREGEVPLWSSLYPPTGLRVSREGKGQTGHEDRDSPVDGGRK